MSFCSKYNIHHPLLSQFIIHPPSFPIVSLMPFGPSSHYCPPPGVLPVTLETSNPTPCANCRTQCKWQYRSPWAKTVGGSFPSFLLWSPSKSILVAFLIIIQCWAPWGKGQVEIWPRAQVLLHNSECGACIPDAHPSPSLYLGPPGSWLHPQRVGWGRGSWWPRSCLGRYDNWWAEVLNPLHILHHPSDRISLAKHKFRDNIDKNFKAISTEGRVPLQSEILFMGPRRTQKAGGPH